MTYSQVLEIVDLKALKAEFDSLWDGSPKTMVKTMQFIIASHCDNAKISKSTANALLNRIEA